MPLSATIMSVLSLYMCVCRSIDNRSMANIAADYTCSLHDSSRACVYASCNNSSYISMLSKACRARERLVAFVCAVNFDRFFFYPTLYTYKAALHCFLHGNCMAIEVFYRFSHEVYIRFVELCWNFSQTIRNLMHHAVVRFFFEREKKMVCTNITRYCGKLLYAHVTKRTQTSVIDSIWQLQLQMYFLNTR